MSEKTINFTPSDQVKTQIDTEVENGDFENANEFLNELLAVHFERKRILALVDEAIEDDNYTPVSSQEFSDIKQEILQNGKAELRKPAN